MSYRLGPRAQVSSRCESTLARDPTFTEPVTGHSARNPLLFTRLVEGEVEGGVARREGASLRMADGASRERQGQTWVDVAYLDADVLEYCV